MKKNSVVGILEFPLKRGRFNFVGSDWFNAIQTETFKQVMWFGKEMCIELRRRATNVGVVLALWSPIRTGQQVQ